MFKSLLKSDDHPVKEEDTSTPSDSATTVTSRGSKRAAVVGKKMPPSKKPNLRSQSLPAASADQGSKNDDPILLDDSSSSRHNQWAGSPMQIILSEDKLVKDTKFLKEVCGDFEQDTKVALSPLERTQAITTLFAQVIFLFLSSVFL